MRARAKTANKRLSRAAESKVQSGWAMRRVAGIDVLCADALSQIPWLVHGFSARAGGDSLIEQERVLNLGYTDWDAREAVERNRRKFQEGLGAQAMPLVALRQIHSDVAHIIAAPPPE